jgi:integrase
MASSVVAIKAAENRDKAYKLSDRDGLYLLHLRGALIVPKPVHRVAITTATEAGNVLRAIEGFEGSAEVHAALRLLPHVFVRPGELRFAEWSDFDLETAVWTIPP